MNKEHFNQLVGNYAKLDNQFNDFEKLIAEYPYSQPVRMLALKSATGLDKKEFQKRLMLAAFYVTDRNVLRSLIEKGVVTSDTREDNGAEPVKKVSKPAVKKTTDKKTTAAPANAEHLRQEVLANLALLQESKTRFLELAELEQAPAKQPAKATKKTTTKAPVAKPSDKAKTAKPKSPRPAKKSTKNTKPSKKEIIDKFIANEPSITPKKAMPDNPSDLSKASSELKEDLVSENLAVIFAKQGKTAKAIEIYKKLIWKFPQKKASFAARIEELKKKQ